MPPGCCAALAPAQPRRIRNEQQQRLVPQKNVERGARSEPNRREHDGGEEAHKAEALIKGKTSRLCEPAGLVLDKCFSKTVDIHVLVVLVAGSLGKQPHRHVEARASVRCPK